MKDVIPNKDNLPHRPATWPGQFHVDLDFLGDPGEWIHEVMQDRYDYILGDAQYLEGLACDFAEAYIHSAKDLCFVIPSNLEKTDEECWDEICEEFHNFLKKWREEALRLQTETNERPDISVSLRTMDSEDRL